MTQFNCTNQAATPCQSCDANINPDLDTFHIKIYTSSWIATRFCCQRRHLLALLLFSIQNSPACLCDSWFPGGTTASRAGTYAPPARFSRCACCSRSASAPSTPTPTSPAAPGFPARLVKGRLLSFG